MNWKDYYLIEGEWLKFSRLFDGKQEKFDSLKDQIILNVQKEDLLIRKRVSDMENNWTQKQPYSGNKNPKEALQILELMSKWEMDLWT